MNKACGLLILFVVLFSLVACQRNEDVPRTTLGECSYYPSFMWSDADTCGVTKRIYLNFNGDAKGDEDCFAAMSFVDKDGNPIPNDILEITVDGKVLQNDTFKIVPSDNVKTVAFRFLPQAEAGNHQGYIKLLSYKLDRFNEQELTGESIDVMKWNLYFNKQMNPLACVIMWIGILIILFILIWFIVIRRVCYPKFGSIQKTFNVPRMAPLIVKFKGARMVIVSASPQIKQSVWDVLWRGKVIYKTHPAFVSPIVLKPGKKNKIIAKVQAETYQVLPNPIPGIGSATIIDIKRNLRINVF